MHLTGSVSRGKAVSDFQRYKEEPDCRNGVDECTPQMVHREVCVSELVWNSVGLCGMRTWQRNFQYRPPYLGISGKMVSLTCPISGGIALHFHGITAFEFLSYPFSPGSAWAERKPRLMPRLSVTESTEQHGLGETQGDHSFTPGFIQGGREITGCGRQVGQLWQVQRSFSRVKCCGGMHPSEVRGMPNHQGGERELRAHRDFDDTHMEAGCTHKQQKQQEFGIE